MDNYDYNLHQKERSRRVVDWLSLPDHFLCDKLVQNAKDFIRFGAVCRAWRTIYKENLHRLPRQPPLLMLPPTKRFLDDHTRNFFDDQTRSFYHISDKILSNFQVPVPHKKLCCGSTYGWLVTLCQQSREIHLFNPFLAVINDIQLPRIPLSSPRKVILSANPVSNPKYTVVAIHGERNTLAFLKPGDKSWTHLDTQYDMINDVIYYRDQLYFVNRFGEVFSCNLNHPQHPKVSSVAPPPHFIGYNHVKEGKYLVESSGNLLLIRRLRKRLASGYTSGFAGYTSGFTVYKLDEIEFKWIEVKSLCGSMVFLGGVNYSLSLTASDFPYCKPNSIYFTDEELHGGEPREMGVFNLEDGSLEPLCPLESNMITPRPIWIEPTARSC